MLLNLILRKHYYNYLPLEELFQEFYNQNNRFTLNNFNNNIYVHSTLFLKISSSSSNGGAFFISTENQMNVVLEFITFDEITSGGYNSGAFECLIGGNLFINALCGSKCQTSTGFLYQFGQIGVPDGKINQITFVSINKCSETVRNCNYAFYIFNGIINNKGLNLSLNNPSIYSTLGVRSSDSVSITHSNFVSNYADKNSCFDIAGDAKKIFLNCNFLDNKQKSTSHFDAIFYIFTGEVIFQYCKFINNAQTNQRLFELFSCKVTLEYSYCDYLNFSGSVMKNLYPTSNSITYPVTLFNTQRCHAQVPYTPYSTRTPTKSLTATSFIQTPLQTIKNTISQSYLPTKSNYIQTLEKTIIQSLTPTKSNYIQTLEKTDIPSLTPTLEQTLMFTIGKYESITIITIPSILTQKVTLYESIFSYYSTILISTFLETEILNSI